MCQFLLSKHADVDVYYYYRFSLNNQARDTEILSFFPLFLDEPDDDERPKWPSMYECGRLLLEAGADPTATSPSSESSPFLNGFNYGEAVSSMAIRLFFSFGGEGKR
jgi:hypothetical protein